jgi:predicted AAA+ superfamily ATPase
MAYRGRLLDGLLDELITDLPAILLVGPRAAGKTTTALQRAASVIRLDVPGEALAFRADPDAIIRGASEPLLLDEWQAVPETFPAVKRAIDTEARPGRFLLTGSAYGDLEGTTAAGTGRIVRLRLLGMTVREQNGQLARDSIIDRMARGEPIATPGERLDIRDYLDLALRSGFPEALSVSSATARQRWLEGYVAQIITRDPTGTVGARDPLRLSRYLEAYALNSAGITEAKSIYEAAGIDRGTAASYERVLENVFVVESLPAWRTNRLKRLTLAPKRYVMDAGLMAAILRTDMQAILRDGKLLGRVIDTFVTQQLRGELEVSPARPRLYHLRDQDGRREVDIIAELGGERILGFEVKAGASVTAGDARHLAWLRDELGDRFVAGAVFHTGPHAFPLGERITALPISTIWAALPETGRGCPDQRLSQTRASGVTLVLGRRAVLRADDRLERGGVGSEPAAPRVRFRRAPGQPVEAGRPAGRVPGGPARLELVGEHQAGALAVGVQLEPRGRGRATHHVNGDALCS